MIEVLFLYRQTRRFAWAVLGAAVLFSAAAARAEGPWVVPVDGNPFQGALVSVDSLWNLTFRTGEKTKETTKKMPAADVVRWGRPVEPERGPMLVTADGGVLVADVLSAGKESLMADSLVWGTLKMPFDSLAGVVFQLPGDRQQRDRLVDRVALASAPADRVLLANGDELAGTLDGIDQRSLRLTTEVGPVEIELDRVAAVVFNPALRRKPSFKGLHAWAGFADGSLLAADRLEVDEKKVTVTTALGQTRKTATEDLVFLQPLEGRVVYLSDRPPADYRHVPYLSLRWPLKADRNVTGGRLRGDGRLYLKGLGMHTAARATYPLDKKYKRFDAALAIDDSTAGRGSVRFRVFVDGREKFTSDTIRGGQTPVPMSVDVAGARRLDLIVDFADRADEMDHANWFDARLVR